MHISAANASSRQNKNQKNIPKRPYPITLKTNGQQAKHTYRIVILN